MINKTTLSSLFKEAYARAELSPEEKEKLLIEDSFKDGEISKEEYHLYKLTGILPEGLK